MASIGGLSYVLMMMVTMVSVVRSDLAKDRDECASQLIGLSTCLPYVSGKAKAPTLDCCTGLKQVIGKSRKCLCILVKDRNDPALDLKINATLALGLPNTCHAPSNASECPALLHLAPNSPEAQVFEQFAKSQGQGTAPSSSSTGNSTPSSTAGGGGGGGGNGNGNSKNAQEKSSAWNGKKWMGVERMVLGILVLCLTTAFNMDT